MLRSKTMVHNNLDMIVRLMATEIFPIKEHLKSGVVIDAGANKGLWSAALALYAPDLVGRLELFEPQSTAAGPIRALMKDIDDCPPWELNSKAVGDFARQEKIFFDREASELATLVGGVSQLPHREVALQNFELVDVVTLDEFCADREIVTVDYLKLDVEGFELQALQGARDLLAHHRIGALSFEFGLNHIGRNTFREFWDLLSGFGYKISLMKRGDGGYDTRPIHDYTTHTERFDWNRYYVAEAP